MATIAELLLTLNEGDIKLRNAIIAKGVDVPNSTPFTELGNKVAAISQEGGGSIEPSPDDWVRPADRPAVPTINEDEIYMLFGVKPTAPNDYAITLTAIGGYTANWGDGTIETVASATKCEHMYDYASLAVTPNADGIKWVWIKFTPVSSYFTVINTNVRHSLRPAASDTAIFVPQVYEMYIQAPNITTWAWASSTSYTLFYMLDVLDWEGTNKITTFYFFMVAAYRLRRLNIDTSKGTNFSYFMQNCYSFNQPLNIDTSNGTNFSYFMYNCHSFNQPLNIDTSNGTNFSFFMGYNYSFNRSMNIDTSNGTNFASFMSSCYSFNQPRTINTANGTNFSSFIGYNYSFNQPLNIDTSKGTNFSYFMNGCHSFNRSVVVNLFAATVAIGTGFIGVSNRAQTGLRLSNMGAIHSALTISNSSLGVAELVALFGDLYNRSATTAGTITITGVFGASQLTTEQRVIATSKNWTIVG